jgi:predicted transposase YbfD/YdcC
MLSFGSQFMSLAAFTQYFDQIQDPRQATKVTYPLFDVLFLTVTAVIGGSQGWEEIEDFGHCHLDWLKQHGDYSQGIPVHDTIARLVSRVDPAHFQSAFTQWMQSTEHMTEGQVIAIDGKTLRGSYNRTDRQSTIHMVNAYATANGMVLGQYKTEAKSNEITAIPALLKLLDIKGCLVSIDAMGCQTAIATTIIEQGGDYLLAVKGNQKNLYLAIQAALSDSLAEPSDALIEQQHGRIECREYHVLSTQTRNNAKSQHQT